MCVYVCHLCVFKRLTNSIWHQKKEMEDTKQSNANVIETYVAYAKCWPTIST